jgi:hypothetical protein
MDIFDSGPSPPRRHDPRIGVEALADRLGTPHQQPALERRYAYRLPTITIGQTVGSGHFNQLEVPAQGTLMFERFLSINPL